MIFTQQCFQQFVFFPFPVLTWKHAPTRKASSINKRFFPVCCGRTWLAWDSWPQFLTARSLLIQLTNKVPPGPALCTSRNNSIPILKSVAKVWWKPWTRRRGCFSSWLGLMPTVKIIWVQCLGVTVDKAYVIFAAQSTELHSCWIDSAGRCHHQPHSLYIRQKPSKYTHTHTQEAACFPRRMLPNRPAFWELMAN